MDKIYKILQKLKRKEKCQQIYIYLQVRFKMSMKNKTTRRQSQPHMRLNSIHDIYSY